MADDTNIAPPATQDNTNVPAATEPAVETPTTPGLMGGEKDPETVGLMGETPEGEPKGDEVKEGEAEGDEADKGPDGAPESYKEFTLNDKYPMTDADVEEFTTYAKEKGWSQDVAQQVLDLDMDRQAKFAEQNEATLKEWQTEVKKEFGDKYTENMAIARKAVGEFADNEAQELFKETGLENHPAIIRMFNAMGKAISEDSFVKGGNSVKGKNEGGLVDMFSDLNKT